MMHHRRHSRSILSALSVFACFAIACGAADEDGTDLPDYLGPVPGSTPVPPTGVQPGAPAPNAPSSQQPAGSQGETPVTNGETPLTGGQNGNGSGNGATPGQGTNPPQGSNPPVANPPADNPPPQNPPDNTPVETPPPDDGPPPANPPRGDRGTANLFVDLLGRTPGEVETKVQTAVDRFFGIGSNDPATPSVNGGTRVFYVLPQDNTMGFIWAADSADIRSEGMSYGMFMAVQMDMQQQFDQLWRFARTFMQYPADSTVASWRRYFRWTGTVNTSNANNWQVNYNAQEAPASDGEEYFATALYLADRRWGSAGEINYQQDADSLSDALLNNQAGTDGRFPLIHTENDMVSFVPYGTSYEFTDPSYHLPAFYEIFAQDGPQRNAERWRLIAETSRAFLVTSANSQTGLHPDYAEYDGSPSQGYEASNHDTFRFDAWRVPMNMAVDFSWSGQDARMRTQTDKYLAFFGSRLNAGNVSNSTFNLDGSGAGGGGASGLVGALGAAALASTSNQRMTVVNNLWNLAQPTGQFRYYQGSVYLLGLLATSGHFDYTFQ